MPSLVSGVSASLNNILEMGAKLVPLSTDFSTVYFKDLRRKRYSSSKADMCVLLYTS